MWSCDSSTRQVANNNIVNLLRLHKQPQLSALHASVSPDTQTTTIVIDDTNQTDTYVQSKHRTSIMLS